MDKSKMAEEVVNAVRDDLSIIDVLQTRMTFVRRVGRNAKGLCPFHNDHTIGSFIATEGKEIWKCFSCGKGGDSIKFVANIEKIHYIEAAFKIALEFGLIDRSQYEEWFARRRFTQDQIDEMEKKYEAIDRKKMEDLRAQRAPLDVLDPLYRLFIELSPLSEDHYHHLRAVRQLSEEEIKEGLYFTFPSRHVMREFSKQLKERWEYDETILKGVPGFFFDKSTNRFSFLANKGIGIGIRDVEGRVIGIQIRHDTVDDFNGRYVWFSSSFAEIEDDKSKWGATSGSPIDVVYPRFLKSETVFVTEGRFKASQLSKTMNAIAVSVQGVGNWKGILQTLKDLPYAEKTKAVFPKPFAVATVLVAFDADMIYKPQVFSQARRMSEILQNEGYPVYYLNWDIEDGKGIDDVIISGNIAKIKRFDKEKFDMAYEDWINTIMEKESLLDINKATDAIFKKHLSLLQRQPLEKNEISLRHRQLLMEKRS